MQDCVMDGAVVCLFAGDCLVYQDIRHRDDQVLLDKDTNYRGAVDDLAPTTGD